MPRIPIIAGNWKMNTNLDEAVALATAIRSQVESVQAVETVLCPPFISLAAIRDRLKGSPILVGAQDMYFTDKGAYTGEISPLMLQGLADYVIIGHSERRQYFGDTDELVAKKVKAALDHGLKPIMCVGESLAQYEAGQTESFVSGQVKAGLAGAQPQPSMTINTRGVFFVIDPLGINTEC